MRPHAFKTAGLALVAALAFESALAYQLLDPPRRWFPSADEPRQVIVDDAGLSGVNDVDGGVSAAIGASEAWNNPSIGGNTLDLINAQAGANAIQLGDGVSHLAFDDPFGVCERTCLAATFTGYYDDNQTATCGGLDVVKIDDADIVFNTDPGFGPFRIGWTSEGESDGCSNETYIETVTSHEIGHLIGLGHEDGVVALMNSSIGTCDNRPILADDVAGRDALYDCAFDGGTGCGDGVCAADETATSCPADCTQCGDGIVSGDEVCELGDTTLCSLLGGFVDNGFEATCSECTDYDTTNCTPCAAEEIPEETCNDGIDNDCDGATDLNDSDCSVCEVTETPETSCSDGVDNDCDGLTDSDDSDCDSGGGLGKGDACTSDSECASGKCRGKPGGKTCK